MATKKKKKEEKVEEEILEEEVSEKEEDKKKSESKSEPAPEKKAKRKRPPRNNLSVAPARPINFKAWFTGMLSRDKRFKEHHYEQFRLFILGMGLTECEEAPQYEKAVKAYFGD